MGYDMDTINGKEYFCANIWGMGRLRELMLQAGVLDCAEGHPVWPSSSKANAADWDESHPEVQKYEKEADCVRSTMSMEYGQVPIFKFGSNDGWIVTPEECEWIVDGVSKFLEEHPDYGLATEEYTYEHRSFFLEWVEYNKKAAKNGGYKVW